MDNTIGMHDEIFYILERLDNMASNNPLFKSRIKLEIIQFKFNNFDNDRFKLLVLTLRCCYNLILRVKLGKLSLIK